MKKSDEMSRLIDSRRTIRQFKQNPIPLEDLLRCIKSAGLAPSAANLQPLEYLLINDSEKVETIFPLLKWAGYIAPNGDPEKGRRPTAYLIVLVNKS
ncbi:MAG: nitroreductase, partial [Candidatus Neomarinimicrobiota bacterium]